MPAMLKLKYFLPVLACAALFLVVTKAVEDTEGATGKASSTCYKSELSGYRGLFEEAFEMKLESMAVYINCMSFNEEGELDSAIVSGNGSSGEHVLEFSCKGNTLLALDSERPFNTTESLSCFSCATDPAAEDACVEPCPHDCERCYEHADNNCDCYNYVLIMNDDAVRDALNELNDMEDEDIEEMIELTIEEHSNCDTVCPENFTTSEEGNERICYACGIRFCSECHEDESGHDECTQCLPQTLLYHEEGECLFGRRAEILEVAEEQEHEVEQEEEQKAIARLTLAITLPIVSVLVIVFFVIMSFIAHKRYPHIGETGQKRHRNKPTDITEEDLPTQDSVFKPRPTVRLR
jgi:hypothetical protein